MVGESSESTIDQPQEMQSNQSDMQDSNEEKEDYTGSLVGFTGDIHFTT